MTATLPDSEQRYRERIARVVAAIARDPMAQRSLDDWAALAHFSPFHFHRIYRGMTGETVAATVRRLRLARAARLLGAGRVSVTQIALGVGYESPQAFTRAFREFTGHAPREFRSRIGAMGAFVAPVPGIASAQTGPRIVERPAKQAIALRHVGPTATIAHTHRHLQRQLAQTRVSEYLGVAWGDADEASVFCYMAAAVLPGDEPAPAGFETIALPAGLFALHSIHGPYTQITAAVSVLYTSWLPASGFEPDDGPLIEVYHQATRDASAVLPHTDLLLPIKPLD